MNPESPWFRFVVGLVAIAIAIRVIVDLLRPTLPFLAGAAVLIATVELIRRRRGR
jgi:hypothetical protein